MNWGDDEICEFQLGAFRFLLQKFYVQEHAGNFMMQLMVEDADTGWQQIERAGLAPKYPGIIATPPARSGLLGRRAEKRLTAASGGLQGRTLV